MSADAGRPVTADQRSAAYSTPVQPCAAPIAEKPGTSRIAGSDTMAFSISSNAAVPCWASRCRGISWIGANASSSSALAISTPLWPSIRSRFTR